MKLDKLNHGQCFTVKGLPFGPNLQVPPGPGGNS